MTSPDSELVGSEPTFRDLLARFELSWTAAAEPGVVANSLQDGAAPEDVRQGLATLGFQTVPPELLTWWAWHNGVADRGGYDHWKPLIRHMRLLPLGDAVLTTRFYRSEWLPHEEAAQRDEELVIAKADRYLGWSLGALPIMVSIGGDLIVLDTADPAGPLHYHGVTTGLDRAPIAANLAHLIAHWTHLLDTSPLPPVDLHRLETPAFPYGD